MKINTSYEEKARSGYNYEKIKSLSLEIFKQGHLDKIDDLIVELIPLCHIVYYKYVAQYDEGYFAREDLISDCLAALYQDMKYRWDKYIHVTDYLKYYQVFMKNIAFSLNSSYHNFYLTKTELETDDKLYDVSTTNTTKELNRIEFEISKEHIKENIHKLSIRLLTCRSKHYNLLIKIYNKIYIDKRECDLKDMTRTLFLIGVSKDLFNFYIEHVRYIHNFVRGYYYSLLGGNEKMLRRGEDIINRFEDVTYKMLSDEYYDSFIPELYAEFGSDITRRFVRIFSNKVVRVPHYKDFCDTLMGNFLLSLTDGNIDNVYRVAEEYKLPAKSLLRIFRKAVKFTTRGGNIDE